MREPQIIIFAIQTLKEEIEATQVDLEDFSITGEQLMTMVGEPEQPEVQNNMEDASSQVNKVTEKYEQRARTLEAALEKAVHFQDELMVCNVVTLKVKRTVTYFIPFNNPVFGDFCKFILW